MISKRSLIPISLLLGCVLTKVVAYPDYEEDTSNAQTENSQNNLTDEIYDSPLLQNRLAENKIKNEAFGHMNMDMNYKTEHTLKNVRNISDNQLSNEYISLEHEDEQDADMIENIENDDNTSIQSTEQTAKNAKVSSNEDDQEKNRTNRMFSKTTTTVPQYIRKKGGEHPILTAEDTDVSSSDYVENEDEMLSQMSGKQYPTNISFNRHLDNSSEENDDIVPLAMKYYDEIPNDNASLGRHTEDVSSEDYYEEEYHDPELAPTTSSTALPTSDNSLLQTLLTGFTTTAAPIGKDTSTMPTPASIPLTTANYNPIIGQFNTSLLTTLAPLPPSPPQPQTQIQTVVGIPTSSHIASAAGGVKASAVNNDKKGKQIPIISTVPVVTTTIKTTTSSRRRLLPHEQLRNYIEDAYIRMPLAVIIDPSTESLEKTKTLWNDAMHTNLNIKIILVTLNESEDSPAAFNFNNTRQFLTALNSIKEQNRGDTFMGISHAAELVPYDSAVFISTARLAKHTDQVQDSAITLLKKRIRLYLIWFGERSLSENETQDSVGGILGEVAIRSGGEILHIVGSENSQELEGSTLTIVADALRGSQEVDVPVDTTLSSLHVKIDKLMRRAVLETPNGG